MLIDTHAHLNFNAYKEDADGVIRRSLENDVWMINVGSQYETSKKATEIAENYSKGVYAAVGLHPIHLAEGIFKVKLDTEEQAFRTKNEKSKSINSFPPSFSRAIAKGEEESLLSSPSLRENSVGEEDKSSSSPSLPLRENSVFDYEKYKNLTQSKKVVAIGETGLDYYYRPKTKIKLEQFENKQKEVFLQHLELAKELNLPIIFHCRMAHDDLIKILNTRYKIQNTRPRGVVHCFTGTWEQAKDYMNMGFYLGFNGIIFKLNLDEIIKKTPLGRILIETDCPYLTPSPMTGRNEPLYVKYVAEKIAEIKKLSFEEIAKITTKNAQELFKII